MLHSGLLPCAVCCSEAYLSIAFIDLLYIYDRAFAFRKLVGNGRVVWERLVVKFWHIVDDGSQLDCYLCAYLVSFYSCIDRAPAKCKHQQARTSKISHRCGHTDGRQQNQRSVNRTIGIWKQQEFGGARPIASTVFRMRRRVFKPKVNRDWNWISIYALRSKISREEWVCVSVCVFCGIHV